MRYGMTKSKAQDNHSFSLHTVQCLLNLAGLACLCTWKETYGAVDVTFARVNLHSLPVVWEVSTVHDQSLQKLCMRNTNVVWQTV